jgi:hypothetical protein
MNLAYPRYRTKKAHPHMTTLIGRTATVTRRIAVGSAGSITVGTPEGFQVIFARPEHAGTTYEEGTIVRIVGEETPMLVTVTDFASQENNPTL